MHAVLRLHQANQLPQSLSPVSPALLLSGDHIFPEKPFSLLKLPKHRKAHQLLFFPNIKGNGVLPLHHPADHIR